MTRATATKIADDLYVIDAGMFNDDERLACYLYDTPNRVLIECGPSVTLHHLTRALDDLGIDDVASILVTHIHLDHAGGAGHLARRYPNATIGVHTAGVRHLQQPERLVASATRIYGEEGMQTLWGEMVPIAPERLQVLEEGDRIGLGNGRHLDVMYTPGHAKHHVVFFDDESGGCYVGDSVGVAFPHGHPVQPLTPPPDLDPHVLVEQLHRMAAREPRYLGFAHFGVHQEPSTALAEAEDNLWAWVRFVESLPPDRDDAGVILRQWVIDGYRSQGWSEAAIATYDKNTYWPMQAAGLLRWLAVRD